MIHFDKLRILYVEDNMAQARLTLKIVEKHLHSKMTHVLTLADALHVVSQNEFDLSLVDLLLPDASGLEALISMQKNVPHIPIIVLTGREEESLAQQAVEAGAQDFLFKSNLDPELLRRSIRYAILRHQTQTELHDMREHQFRRAQESPHQIIEIDWKNNSDERENGSHDLPPLRKRDPVAFNRLTFLYEHMLTDFIQRVNEGKNIFGIGRVLGVRLLEVEANPNDVNDIHQGAMHKFLHEKNHEEKKQILIDGRMFALEVMGYLAEAYRTKFLEKKIL